MNKCTITAPDLTVGIDLGDRYSHFEIVGSAGETNATGRFRTTPKGLEGTFGGRDRLRIAFETGTHSHWVKDILEDLGHEVIVANARKAELIWRNERKSDERDCALRARLARVDPKLLSPVTLRDGTAQDALATIRARENLVTARTRLINGARGLVKSRGGRLPSCSSDSFHRKAEEKIPEVLKPAIEPMVETVGHLTEQVRHFDKMIEEISKTSYPVTRLLRQVKGVGPITALAYVLVIANPRRFGKGRSVGAYVGLVTRRNQSSRQDPELRISKTGNALLRRLLVQSSQYILGPFGDDCDLRRFGEGIARQGGKKGKKRAVVAVARKLAVLLHRLWITGAEYEPLRNARARGGKRGKGGQKQGNTSRGGS